MKVIDQTLLKKVIIERPHSSHKGDYGRLLLIGGTYPYGGAIIMAALGAVRSGAGLVTVATYLHSAIAQELAGDNFVVLPTTISQHIPAFMKKIQKDT